MATVPYSGVETVDPQQTAAPGLSVQASPNAFGAGVGEALGQFGKVTQGVGDEIYQRAYAMQQMDQEAQARNADAQYQIKAGQLHADFTSKLGADAGPEALAAHSKDLQDLRASISGGLSSPFAQKTFDSMSLPVMGRTIFNAAGHSAEQMKQNYLGSLNAQLGAAKDSALSNPGDDVGFKANVQATLKSAQDFAAGHGWDKAQTDQYVTQQTSGLYAQRIQGLARTDAVGAKRMFDAALGDGSLRGEDISKLKPVVDAALQTRGAKQIADGILDGSGLSLGRAPVAIERAMDAIGMIESGNTYTKVNTDSGALGRYQVMPANLPGWLKQAGQPGMTPQQFLANPAAQDAVFKTVFGGYMQTHGNFNDATSRWFTGRTMAEAGNASDGTTTAPQYIARANAVLSKSASPADLVAAGKSEADRHPDVPLLGDAIESRIIAQTRQQNALERQTSLQAQSTIESAIADTRGGQPATLDELGASDPKVQSAIDGLDGKGKLRVQRQLAAAQAADNVPSAERDANRQRLTGLAYSNPQAFQDTDFYHENLTADDRKAMLGMKAKSLSGSMRDPHVDRALGQLKTQMDAAGIDPKDKEDYDKFVGSLADEMRVFGAQNSRPPSTADVSTIGRRLLTEQTVKSWLPWGSTSKTYQMTPPDDISAKIRSRLGPNASDDQVRQTYVRMQYNALTKKETTPGG